MFKKFYYNERFLSYFIENQIIQKTSNELYFNLLKPGLYVFFVKRGNLFTPLKDFFFYDMCVSDWKLTKLNKSFSSFSFFIFKDIHGASIFVIYTSKKLPNLTNLWPSMHWAFREQMEFYQIYVPFLNDYRNLLLDYGIFLKNSSKLTNLYENYSYNVKKTQGNLYLQSYPDL